MVGDAGLRIIVRSDLGGTVTRRYHRLTLGCDTVQILLVLHIVQTGTELFQCPVEVLELRTLLLTLNHNS